WRRRGRKAEQTPAAPVISPAEAALASLGAIERQKPPAKEFHLRLSETLRAYLEDGLAIDAREATSGEILTRVRKASVEGIAPFSLEAFLLENDLVKSAKECPPLPDLLRALSYVRGIVEATRPRSAS